MIELPSLPFVMRQPFLEVGAEQALWWWWLLLQCDACLVAVFKHVFVSGHAGNSLPLPLSPPPTPVACSVLCAVPAVSLLLSSLCRSLSQWQATAILLF